MATPVREKAKGKKDKQSRGKPKKAKGKDLKKKSKKSRKQKKERLTAKTADRHQLYEDSVQNPEEDIRFLNRLFKRRHGNKPLSLREDFCGTAYLCAEWVRSNPLRTAIGLDLHAPTMDWGREKHLAPLGEQADRVTLLEQNVMTVTRPPVDACVAFNFSYCVFHERADLRRYFECVYQSLNEGGTFVLDIHGGPEAYEGVEEETKYDHFTYVWDQEPIDALTNKATRYIHFRFKDGSKMKKAFVYDWRIWTMPELRDLLTEVGFRDVEVYWEGFDKKTGEGNGVFRKVEKAENDESWIAYVLGWK